MPIDDAAPDPRPASPFLILLLGSASSALGAEWLRFQWGAWLALPLAVAGGIVTLTAVTRAYRARRRWRRRRTLADEAARAVPAAPGGDALADQEPALVRASRAKPPASRVAGRTEAHEAPPATPAADGERRDRRPAGAAPAGSGEDRERVGAVDADADRDR
jgi:hypothetical protein